MGGEAVLGLLAGAVFDSLNQRWFNDIELGTLGPCIWSKRHGRQDSKIQRTCSLDGSSWSKRTTSRVNKPTPMEQPKALHAQLSCIPNDVERPFLIIIWLTTRERDAKRQSRCIGARLAVGEEFGLLYIFMYSKSNAVLTIDPTLECRNTSYVLVVALYKPRLVSLFITRDSSLTFMFTTTPLL